MYIYKVYPTQYYGGMRRQCEYEDCVKLGRNKGWYKGNVRYDRFCEQHHRLRAGEGLYQGQQIIPNKVCENCGWDKTGCDRHRRVRERGYFKENVIVLCPNCHRLAHQNLLDVDLLPQSQWGEGGGCILKPVSSNKNNNPRKKQHLAERQRSVKNVGSEEH